MRVRHQRVERVSTELRCPNCGGLVGADADWCGQCYAPLDRSRTSTGQPGAPPPEAGRTQRAEQVHPPGAGPPPPGAGPVRRTEGGLVWACPRCELENPIETRVCSRCGARFESLFREPDAAPTIDPDRAAWLSLLFPGAGHMAAGRTADGIGRAVIFAWTALTAVAILIMRGGFRAGRLLPLLLLYLAAAAGVYGVTVVDARRAAGGEAPVLSSRVMLYGVTGLILLTVATLFLFGVRTR